MRSDKEEKDHLSYAEVEKLIIAADVFKNILFAIEYPNNRGET